MSDGKIICRECRFELSQEEALITPAGKVCPRCKEPLPSLLLLSDFPDPEPKKSAPLLSDGTIFDKYRILSFLGAGGMGEAYKAEHLLLKQTFALKVMKKLDSADESAQSKRFLREAKCFHLLEHPHIVRIFDIGCDPASGALYIAMEYLAGGSLEKAGKLSEDELLKVASDMAQALLELEKHQMVHRDIKPSNILRAADGSCKLTDLGIARRRGEAGCGNTLTLDNCFIGTAAYTSPEQCRSPHDADSRSDIYSLGVTLYQLASGALPYEGETPIEMALNVLGKEPIPLRKLVPELSENVAELIGCMMEKAPENRPQSALELSRMIEALRRGEKFRPVSRRSMRKKIFAAALLLLLGAGVTCKLLWEPLFSKEEIRKEKSSLPPKAAPPAPAEFVTAGKTFLQSSFISADEPRTLSVRLEEFRKIIAFLKSPDAEGVSFREERLKFFVKCEKQLALQLKRRKSRQERRDRVAPDPALKADIEKYLKSKTAPFTQTPAGVHLMNRILAALRDEKLDPDTLFADDRGFKRSLTGLALNGMLPMPEHLLKKLIFSGADINAGHGPEKYLPRTAYAWSAKARMTGIMTVNGADNVERLCGKPMILRLIDSYPAYRVCRTTMPPDWFLINLLVESGARLDIRDSRGRTLLHLAALHDKDDLLTKLFLAGAPADSNSADNSGETPYQAAIRNHALKAAKVLERFGLATPVTEADRAQGSLLFGIVKDEPLQVEQALDAGASLEYIHVHGLNALQNAVVFGRSALVKFLLERGASFESNAEKVSIASVAVCAGLPGVFRMIIEKNPPENMTVRSRTFNCWLPGWVISHCRKNPALAAQFIDIMQAHKWDINRPGTRGVTVLEAALFSKELSVGVIRVLLAKGALPDLERLKKRIIFKNLPLQVRQMLTAAAAKKTPRS